VGNDSNGSSFDGNGDTMEEELTFGKNQRSMLKGKSPYAIEPIGDLAD
jgi:hypothetical protein